MIKIAALKSPLGDLGVGNDYKCMRYAILLYSLIILLLQSCNKKHEVLEELEELKEEIAKEDEPVSRTILVYMAADNDLSDDAYVDLEEMQRGFTEKGTNLLVFIDPADDVPQILEITPGGSKTVKVYPEFNSADAVKMGQVLSEMIRMYPADESGLILWSHGTSWLPAGSRLRSFGRDNGKQMNIPDLANNLPAHFDFILFDACLMGSVEVAYELKDKADYIIASSTETIYEGFPYDLIITELLQTKIDFNAVAESYFDYYNAQDGAYRSATISVIETRYLPELAYSLKELFENNAVNLQAFDRTSVQRLDTFNEQYVFDLSDFVDKLFPDANKTDFKAQLNRIVRYKNHTPQFLLEYNINTYCGLSCYIPHPERNDLTMYYKTLKWYKDVYP